MSESYSSSVSEDSQPPRDVVYPLNEETEVPDTDGGLSKTVLVEGTGTRPAKGAKVTVHYVGTLEDGTKFDSSRDRDECFEFTIGKGQVIKGWDRGVATMRVGEKAILKCSPEYGYGAAGSPPKIPANATLLFEVELFDWTREVDISAAKDKSILKDVLCDGVDYENPDFESDVTLNLSVYTAPFQKDSPNDPKPVFEKKEWQISIGETSLPPFLEHCLKTMRKKETAACRIRSGLIPEAVPEFSIPSEADRSSNDVTYLIEIHKLHTVKTWEFKGAEKIAEGLKRKDKGNEALKAGDPVRAERFYRRALEFVGEDFGYDEADKAECHKARVVVMNNLAQVLLDRKAYREAAGVCKDLLAVDPANPKGLFRSAKALNSMQEWDEALAAVKKLIERDPDNADAKALQESIQTQKKEFDRKQKGLFKKLFS